MRTISLKSVQIEGFKSYISYGTDLTDDAGLRFLSGVNETSARLGANGAGKSAFFDAIFWCFYGTSIRDKRTSDIKSNSCVGCVVNVFLTIDGNQHNIERSGPPNKITIDGKPSTQDDVDRLLGLNKARFKHSVIFGQGIPLFYDMSSSERGLLLDDILNLNIWLKLADLASKESRAVEVRLTSAQTRKSYAVGNLDALDNLDALKKKAAEWEKEKELELAELTELIQSHSASNTALSEEIEECEKKLKNLKAEALDDDISELQSELRVDYGNLTVLKDRRAERGNSYHFFSTHLHCPTCSQQISTKFRLEKVAELEREIGHIDDQIDVLTRTTGEVIAVIDEAKQIASNHSGEINALERRLGTLQETEKTFAQQIGDALTRSRKLAAVDNPFLQDIQKVEKRFAEAKALIASIDKEIDVMTLEQGRYDYWKDAFKQIRLQMVRDTLQLIEVTASNVASAFGLNDWTIKLSTELETKSGTVRPGIHLTLFEGNAPVPREFSPGEEQRIRLAVALGLGSVIEQLAGVRWRLQVFDEPSNWLASEGIEDLLSLLGYRATSEDKVCWVIDHRALIHAGFSEIWQATKTADGSTIKRLTS